MFPTPECVHIRGNVGGGTVTAKLTEAWSGNRKRKKKPEIRDL